MTEYRALHWRENRGGGAGGRRLRVGDGYDAMVMIYRLCVVVVAAGLGLGVGGLGFVVWGLGFGVCGVGLGV